MKIVQVITLFDSIYGAQKHVLDLSEGLTIKNHKVLIVTGKKGKISKIAESKKIDVIEFSSLKREFNFFSEIRFIINFIKFLKIEKPDYVHSHSSKAGFLVRLVCFFMNVPNSFTAHGWSFEDGIPFIRRSFYRIIETLIGFISYKIIAVSEFGKKYATNLKVVNPQKIEVIPYGVKKQEKLINKSYTNRPLILIMVAGFREQKDHKTLFYALLKLKDLNWEIYFVGDGPFEDEFKMFAVKNGIIEKCHFIGSVVDVTNYYLKSDIKILSTKWEGLPISILEALSFGMPVIASDVGGISEEVINDWNGFLVSSGSVLELENTIRFIFNNSTKIEQMSINSLSLYNEKYQLNDMIEKIEKHYFDSMK
jgi:glycosyltransferase involved in cell wall biosynthesis